MKTAKTRNFFAGLLALIAICLFGAGSVTGNLAKKANAATGDTHTLTFVTSEKTPSQNYSAYYRNNAGNTSCAASDNNSIAIAMSAADDRALVHLGQELNLTEGATYRTTFTFWLEAATAGDYFAVHLYALHASPSLIKDWMSTNAYANPTVIENEFTYSSSANSGNFTFQINDASGAGTVHISDIVVQEVTKTSVTEGSAIGTLPAVPEKSGCEGAWTIDGEKIAADTVYGFTEDKTAVIVYSVSSYTLTFEKTGTATVPSKSLDQYFMANAGSPAVAAYGENGAAITFTSASDKALINIGAEMGLTVGKTYLQSFKIRLEKAADAAGNFAVHPFGLHVNYSERANNKNHLYFVNGSPMWLTSASDSFGTEKTLTNKFTYDGTNDGSFVLQFNGSGNSGTLYISDLTLAEDLSETRTVTADAEIGTLPEVTQKEFYDGYWTIDGEKIAADMVYTYGADKTAVQTYTPKEYTLTFMAEGRKLGEQKYTVETKTEDIAYPEAPEKNGHAAQWERFDPTQGGDRIVNAYYDIDVTVLYKDENGEILESTVLKYGAKLGELPTIKQKTGYTASWTIEGEEIDSDYVIESTDEIVVVATYETIEYRITFIGYNGVTLGEATYTVETKAEDIEYPEVPADPDGNTKGQWENFNIANGGDVIIVYEYETTTAKITFVDENGKLIGSRKVKIGEPVGEFPEVESRSGYVVEWRDGETAITSETVLSEDITVKAVYVKEEQTSSGTGCSSSVQSVALFDLTVMAVAFGAALAKRRKNDKE